MSTVLVCDENVDSGDDTDRTDVDESAATARPAPQRVTQHMNSSPLNTPEKDWPSHAPVNVDGTAGTARARPNASGAEYVHTKCEEHATSPHGDSTAHTTAGAGEGKDGSRVEDVTQVIPNPNPEQLDRTVGAHC